MLCQRCKKREATMNFIELIHGDKVGYNLCAKCYAEMFGTINSALDGDILAGLFGQSENKRVRSCPVCGISYSDFERTGLLGCASCYDVFKEELMPYIERIQGKVMHVGKVGQNAREQDLTRTLSQLQEQLERAVRDKNYLAAERINIKISQVRRRMSENGEGDK
jgi:uvrB/uvrC protein